MRLTRRRDERHAALEAAASAAVLRDHELRAEQTLHNGDIEGVEATEIDEFDNAFGDGTNLMNVNLPDNSALSQHKAVLLENLNKKLDEVEFKTCNNCLGEGFDLSVEDGRCSSCHNDTVQEILCRNGQRRIKHPGTPFTDPLMEDMLIARVKSYMQVRWTKGQQLCYQDHIINFRQDITEIAALST